MICLASATMAALIFLFLNLVASLLKSKRWGNRAAEDRSLSNILYLASIWVIPIIVAITFHEAAHGFVAHLFGDETAWRLGRVSFNPLKHIRLGRSWWQEHGAA